MANGCHLRAELPKGASSRHEGANRLGGLGVGLGGDRGLHALEFPLPASIVALKWLCLMISPPPLKLEAQ